MQTGTDAHFSLPGNALTVTSRGRDGWPLRSMVWLPAQARCCVLLLNGRGDFIEKYAELIHLLIEQGFAVATLDWRGQGLSGTMTPPPRRTHIGDFGVWVEDAKLWLQCVVASHWRGPKVMLAHSMGGHLGLRLMHDLPGLVSRAVLLAPMLGLLAAPFSPRFARRVASFAVRTGQGQRFAFGQLPFSETVYRSAARMNRLTSDRARFAQEGNQVAANPALAIGGVSFGWVNAAFQSSDLVMSAGYPESITVPTRVFTAEREVLVDNSMTQAFVSRMPHGAVQLVADGRHELFRERDAIRIPVLEQTLAFLQPPPA